MPTRKELYILVLFLLSSAWVSGKPLIKSRNSLADSLFVSLSIADTNAMPPIFDLIKKNRKKLNSLYVPLLHNYVNTSKNLTYDKGAMEAYDRIGLQYRFDQLFDSSVIYHNLSLDIALKLNDKKQQFYNYNNLGQVYRIQDLNAKAIAYYHKALEISEKIGDKKSSSFTMNSLGAAYLVQQEPDKALSYFQKSAVIAEHRNDTRTQGHNFSSIGQLYLDANQLDSALHYLLKAKDILLESKWYGSIAITNTCLAQVYFEQERINESEMFIQQSLPNLNDNRNKRYRSIAFAYLGKIKIEQHKTDSAILYLNMAKKLAQEAHSYHNLKRIYEAFFELYQKEHHWEKAIHSLKLVHIYNDSIINLTNNRVIQNIEVAYQSKQKIQQIELLSVQNQIKSQRIKLVSIVALILLIIVALIVYLQFLRKKQNAYEQDKLKQQLMLSQMNPHFIYNALGSIQSYMYRNDGKKAAAYLGNFAALSRSILNNSSAEEITLEEEITTLQNYLELEKMRLQGNLEYTFNLNDADAEFIKIPPMMIQPFIENAIKHGFKELEYKGNLELNFEDLNNLLKVDVIDNGIGINQTQFKNANHESKATEIFNQRMKIIQKKHGSIPDLRIIDLSNKNSQGTQATFYLPINNNL